MYQALASPIGIIVVVSNVGEAKSMFSQVRNTNGDSALWALSFIPSPYSPRTELWIVKKKQHKLQEEELDTSLPIDILET
jgi:hypothetical protein